jgi:hypothetical protein
MVIPHLLYKSNGDKMQIQYKVRHADQITTERLKGVEVCKQGGSSMDTSLLSFILSEAY